MKTTSSAIVLLGRGAIKYQHFAQPDQTRANLGYRAEAGEILCRQRIFQRLDRGAQFLERRPVKR